MAFQLVLFDVDDTLFDFAQSEIIAFHATLSQPVLERIPDANLDEMYEHYKKISRKMWARVEQNRMNKDFLKVERFKRLFKKYKVKKLDAQLIADQYLSNLAKQAQLIEGALEVCTELKKHCRLGLVTNGIDAVQRGRLERSGMGHLFDFMVVSEECGFAKPDTRIFKYTLEKALHSDVKTVLMVGDRLEADIHGANEAGITSCWFNPNKSIRKSKIEPHHEIHHLNDLLKIAKPIKI